MSIESRRRRPPYNGPFLSILNTPSSSSSSIRSSDGGFSQPPPTQHLVIREPKKWTQKEDVRTHQPRGHCEMRAKNGSLIMYRTQQMRSLGDFVLGLLLKKINL
jgi:hypothetical protein